MISVLIPVYNVICLTLVEKIHAQLVAQHVPFEILLADDASPIAIREANKSVERWKDCRYFQLERNHGPAFVRNYLADQAQYPYLLFLDTDVLPVSENFIATYLHEALADGVVCGGFLYPRQQVPDFAMLRYKYGIKVEEMSAAKRNLDPYSRFIGMNFLIARQAFMRVRFDETFYFGYEDAHFGLQLAKAAVPIRHIDNEVFHIIEVDSQEYLRKIRCSVRNLKGHEEQMRCGVKLLRWYFAVHRFHLDALIAILFQKTEKKLVQQLTSSSPSLMLFAFYKLGYLCAYMLGRPTLGQ